MQGYNTMREGVGGVFVSRVQTVESITSTMLCVCLGSREYRLFDFARTNHLQRERRTS